MTTKEIIVLLQRKVSLYQEAIKNLEEADSTGVHVDESPEGLETEKGARKKAWDRRKESGEL
jgi:hypothetical protein